MSRAGLSTERIERALATAARVVTAPGGEAYVPIFERLEREVADRRRQQDAVARARAIAAAANNSDPERKQHGQTRGRLAPTVP